MKLFFLCLCFVLASCASHKGTKKFTRKEIFYTDARIERQSAELLLPETGGNRPGVIVVHGGGWAYRNYSDMGSVSRSLASHGYVVLSINYRFEKHPAPVDDLKTALAWLRKRAVELRLDPGRIGVWGYSSGAHTASLVALETAGTTDAVQAVVAGGGPYDLTWYTHGRLTTPYMGNIRDKMLQEYFRASPAHIVTPAAPPFFLYHGEQDKLVRYEQMTAFNAKLRQAGVEVKRYRVPFWGHANTFIFSDRAVEKGVRFLHKHLKDSK